MLVLPKLIYRFSAISIKIPARFFVYIDKVILKCIWKCNIVITKTIWKRRLKWGIRLIRLIIQLVITTMWYWQRGRQHRPKVEPRTQNHTHTNVPDWHWTECKSNLAEEITNTYKTKNKLLIHAATWKNLQGIVLSGKKKKNKANPKGLHNLQLHC